jgi:hypothetical protein
MGAYLDSIEQPEAAAYLYDLRAGPDRPERPGGSVQE